MTLITSQPKKADDSGKIVSDLKAQLASLEQANEKLREQRSDEAAMELSGSINALAETIEETVQKLKGDNYYDKELSNILSAAIEKSMQSISEELAKLNKRKEPDFSAFRMLAEKAAEQNRILSGMVDKMKFEVPQQSWPELTASMVKIAAAVENNNMLLQKLLAKPETDYTKPEQQQKEPVRWEFKVRRDPGSGNIISVEALPVK
jgi:hypothetical protein